MSSESKELERLQSEIQLLTTEISRSSLLRLSVAAFLILSCAHAFRRVDRMKTEPKMNEINTLAPLTGEDTSTLNVDPFQGFFLLRNMFGNKSAQSAPGRTQGKPCVSAAESEAASTTLRRYAEANKDEELKQVLATYKAEQSACPAQGKQAGAGQTFLPSPAQASDTKFFLVTDEISRKAGEAQKVLAEEVGKAYDAAFETELKLVGATIDLRNWFAFLPFLFLLSEVYLYILRRKRLMLAAAAALRVKERLAEEGGAVLTVERLMLYDGARVPPAYARHPSQFLEAAGAVIALGLLIYLATTALPFFLVNSVAESAGVPDILFSYVFGIGLPIIIVLSTVAFYAAAYAVSVSGKLERQVGRGAGFTPAPGRFRTYWDRAKGALRRAGSVRRPRRWMVSGCSLILLTLVAGVGFDSCGSPARGYKLFTHPAQIDFVPPREGEKTGTTNVKDETSSLGVDQALWVTAFWGLARASGTEADGVWVARAVRLTQFAGQFVYAVALLLSLLTLALLMPSAARVGAFRSRRLCLAFYWVSLWALIFFVTDLFLYFVMPRLRLAVLVAYLGVPFCLWLWHRVARRGGGRWPQVRDVLRVVYFPAALLACLVLAAMTLFTIYLFLVSTWENEKQTVLHYAITLGLAIFYNVGIGLTLLYAGTGALCLGYRRLYDAAADGEATSGGPAGEAPPVAPG